MIVINSFYAQINVIVGKIAIIKSDVDKGLVLCEIDKKTYYVKPKELDRIIMKTIPEYFNEV